MISQVERAAGDCIWTKPRCRRRTEVATRCNAEKNDDTLAGRSSITPFLPSKDIFSLATDGRAAAAARALQARGGARNRALQSSTFGLPSHRP